MPESRGRRPKKPTQRSGNSTKADTTTKMEQKEIDKPPPEQRRSRPLEIWKDVWAILGPLVTMTTLSFLLWPQIQIDAGPNPNPAEPGSAEFIISNVGRVPVFN